MNESEAIALAHLKFRGFASPVFEPDGQTTPDFLLDERIAVEIRRLNNHERNSQSPRGLEETALPLLIGMQKLQSHLDQRGTRRGTLDSISADRARLGPSSRSRLAIFLWRYATPIFRAHQCVRSLIARRLGLHHVQILPMTCFIAQLSQMMMRVVGLDDFERNLRLCIDAKSRKTAAFRWKCEVWWLLLVDHVAYGLSDFSRTQFRQSVHIEHWDKMIVVSPLNHTYYFGLV